MPSTSLKPLHVAKSMEELDVLAKPNTDFKTKSTTQLVSSANTLFQAGEKSFVERDEEKAYTIFIRFLELIMSLGGRSDFSKMSDYNKLMKNANLAIVKAEDLKSSLLERYRKSIEDINCKAKNDRNEIISALHNKSTDITASGDNNDEITQKKDLPPELSISCSKLFSLLTTNHASIILMDTRSSKDFEESHINHNECINVPQEILTPGITAAKLERLLPTESVSCWDLRGAAEFVILIDWNSMDDSKPSIYINVLKQAMLKWDQKCTLKKPPIILQGGYEDWMLKYPMHTTRALNFNLLNSNSKTSPRIADVSDVDYPDLDENLAEKKSTLKENLNEPGLLFKKSSVPLPVVNNSISPNPMDSRKTKSAPGFNRKSKPSNINSKPSSAVSSHVSGKKNENVSPHHMHKGKTPPITILNNSFPINNLEKVSNESKEKGTLLASLMKEESLTKDSLELAREQLSKEQEFEKLCLRKEKEAEESMRLELQKQENILIEKLKELNMNMSEKDAECVKVKEENIKIKKQLDEYKDKDLQRQKEKVIAADLEKRNLQEQVKRLREERKLKDAKKKLELKSDAVPRNIASANSGLKRHVNAPGQNNSHNNEYTVPLSRQSSTDSSSRGLVRSHSSPNIAQMVNQEENNQRKLPAFDRNLKPPATPTYQSNEISRARLRNLNPVYGNCTATGLRNLGNTCFMNSVIQCLSNTIPLAEYFMSNQYLEDINRDNKQGMSGEVAEEFAVVIRTLWMGQYKSFSPKDFKMTVSKCLSVCIGNEQQDSHEFLVVLMERLHADLNKRAVKNVPKLESCNDENTFWQHHKSFNSSKMSEIFEGLLKSTLTCLTCKKTSDSYEVFSCLSLPILASRCSLRDCFKHFLKSEKISGEAAWDCPRCKQKKEAEKRLHICRLPEILVIQLKRFSYEGLWRRKLQTHVDFDFSFELPYERNSEENFRKYSLYSLVNHYGTLEGGHYTAFANANSNKWFKYDDHEVSEISLSDIRTSAAYLLFYRANDLRSNL